MKVATWNVNSIRSRLDHTRQWLQSNPVDVLCLQETKVVDEDFPTPAFEELGYIPYVYGQKSYNGVALISRQPMAAVQRGFSSVLGADRVGNLDDQKRVIAGRYGDVYIVNLYVPNGNAVGSDKYAYKLSWLDCLRDYLAALLEQHPRLNVCGDFNIAPEDKDIYNADDKTNHIMASPAEREALQKVLAVGLADGFRKFTDEGGHFSWWDYRAGSFRRNLGWRIDHHYLSAPLYDRATACTIDIEPRRWDKPSDHTPVILEF
ncbi:MAG TPA: exodeoxyribonuclease III [Leptolyngbyaceae cyanobacterium M65_K2018_010]|nr:exodeoxyribonuclease III [Leptolyngbyaceae cyanobacterium M65_K2018_010]